MFVCVYPEDRYKRVVEVQLKSGAFFVKKWLDGVPFKQRASSDFRQAHHWGSVPGGPVAVWEFVKEKLGGWNVREQTQLVQIAE